MGSKERGCNAGALRRGRQQSQRRERQGCAASPTIPSVHVRAASVAVHLQRGAIALRAAAPARWAVRPRLAPRRGVRAVAGRPGLRRGVVQRGVASCRSGLCQSRDRDGQAPYYHRRTAVRQAMQPFSQWARGCTRGYISTLLQMRICTHTVRADRGRFLIARHILFNQYLALAQSSAGLGRAAEKGLVCASSRRECTTAPASRGATRTLRTLSTTTLSTGGTTRATTSRVITGYISATPPTRRRARRR